MNQVVDEIKRIFEIEQKQGGKAVEITDVPGGYDAITPSWLTKVLCRDSPGAEVTSFSLDESDDGSSNRRRIFLTYNDAGKRAGLPATVFCKAAEKLSNRIVLGASGAAQTEANFYNKVRPYLDIEAPVALYANYDPQSYAYFIMLEDLGSKVQFCDDRTEIDWERINSLIDLLARLHASYYQHPDLGSASLPFPRWTKWWLNNVGSFDFEGFCDKAFVDAERVIPARLFKRRGEIWPCTMRSAERHGELPETLIHCDVHLKNWYLTADNRMGLSDWQILSVGHWSRDYIYATTTALSVENRRKWERELLKIYLDKVASLGVPPIDFDEALKNCRQQLFTALAFWTITLRPATGMPDMQPERTTFEFLNRLATAIDDLDAVDSFK